MSILVWLLAAFAVAAGLLLALLRTVVTHAVYEWERGLLYVNGQYQRTLGPGRHQFFRPLAVVEVFKVRVADQITVVGPIDVLSEDRLPFRIGVTVVYTVLDARAVLERQSETLLRQTIIAAATRLAAASTLQAFLEARADAGATLVEAVAGQAAEYAVTGAFITTLQLPPEIRRLFSEVEKARLEGLAALERARGEHAALRTLANAARILKDNPELTNLRLLQAVSATPKGATTLVLGQGALIQGSVSGAAAPPPEGA